MSGQQRLGVGVIGAHAWAEQAHLPGYAAYDRVELVAICDIVPERAEAMAEKFGIRKIYTDAHELIDDPEVQMVDVCTPTDTHLPLSLAAIDAGKHVLSEKPLAHDAEDAFAAAALAQRNGRAHQAGLHLPLLARHPPDQDLDGRRHAGRDLPRSRPRAELAVPGPRPIRCGRCHGTPTGRN